MNAVQATIHNTSGLTLVDLVGMPDDDEYAGDAWGHGVPAGERQEVRTRTTKRGKVITLTPGGLTSRQSFAIFCKTGYDVRNCPMSRHDVDFIMGSFYLEAGEFIKARFAETAIYKTEKGPKGKYLDHEYGLLYDRALQQGRAAYTQAQPSGRTGGARVEVTGFVSGFGRWLAKDRKQGDKSVLIRVQEGPDKAANMAAAGAIAKYLQSWGKVNAVAIG